eukprot:scaffold1104_cov299-Prasinococcus_capsulatus_cf.AAC.3
MPVAWWRRQKRDAQAAGTIFLQSPLGRRQAPVRRGGGALFAAPPGAAAAATSPRLIEDASKDGWHTAPHLALALGTLPAEAPARGDLM